MPIGACIAAEAAKLSEHEVSFLDVMFVNDIKQKIEQTLSKLKPDIVGVSVRNIDDNDMSSPRTFFQDVLQITEIIRNKSNAKIILGGAAIGIMPEQLLKYTKADLAVLGYGETVFPKLLKAIEEKQDFANVEGTAWIENGNFIKNNINAARSNICPVPDLSKWIDVKKYLSHFAAVPLQSKRGCPYKCVYCTYAAIEGENYCLSEPDFVVNEIRKLAEKGIRDIEFVDNVFNSPYEHAIEICKKLTKANLPVRLQSMELNPKFIDDNLLDAMEDAGFVGTGITAESADDKALESLGKNFTSQDVYRAADVISRHKIPCFWIFLFGGPKETLDSVQRTLAFAEKYIRKSDTAFFNVGIRVYPGTALEQIARAEGLLNAKPEEMLDTKFYFSHMVERERVCEILKQSISKNINFIDSESFTLPGLEITKRLMYLFGVKQPLWKYTSPIRRIMQFSGMYK
jgi:radical SAM superfamily enzyme YgiQ (UPF0313 family)